ncbi:MAG: L-threonylcarbamoyladenylate synthase [Candidatus Nanopelagicales bacterium]
MIEIKDAAMALKNGFLVAFPTETVYGLGADATNANAVSRIFSVKNRPINHPLILHIGNIEDFTQWAIEIPNYAFSLAKKYWPGPMTLILKRNEKVKDFVTGSQDTVGIRIPNNELALSLLSEFKKIGSGAIVAPSANKFGKVSPTTYEHVYQELSKDLSKDDLILDGGQSQIGVESTIIDCTKEFPSVLRPGAILNEMINEVIELDLNKSTDQIRVSGSFKSHYAPNAKVLLDQMAEPGDGFIALNNVPTPVGAIRLNSPSNIEEFTKYIYADLRKADELKLTRVVVIQPEGSGLAVALRDRLKKASS